MCQRASGELGLRGEDGYTVSHLSGAMREQDNTTYFLCTEIP